jgi:hypothetical protein
MIYHLVSWNEEKHKWNKKPVGLDGAPLPTEQGIPTSSDRAAVVDTVNALNAGQQPPRYMLGLWLHPDSQFFFLDLDDNAVQDGRLTPFANALASPFVTAGCYFEASTSGRGAHIIGRYHGVLQPFSTSRKRVHPHEFFVRDRGVVLNPDAHSGDWNADATALLPALLTEHFPPRHANDELFEFSDTPRTEWRGPVDDDDLIRRFLSATGSAAARLRGSISLPDLWNGRCPHSSESDLALASHLAFWTGCAAARIERLMRRSPLAAHRLDKWDSHRTYLRELTIREACVTTRTVYHEPERVDTAAAILGIGRPPLRPLTAPTAPLGITVNGAPTELLPPLPAADWHAMVDQAISAINNAGTFKELADNVMPGLGNYGFPRLHGERIVTALGKKLEIFDAKMSVSQLRALVMPPALAEQLAQNTVPEWAQSLVYLIKSDKFFDTATTDEYSHEAVRMAFNRHMPMKPTGSREDVIVYLRDRWQIDTLEDAEYRPDQPPTFEHAGKRFANRFLASTMPTPVIGSDECSQCIRLLQEHLYSITNRRDAIYWSLLYWLAHNVQRPGVKIRWSPLIKGVPGDGKSIIGDLLFAALGAANVKITSPNTLSNSGGFTDWALGGCVNVIEEIRLEGKERRRLYNGMKTIIGDSRIDPNRKGKASSLTLVNVTNHAAFTNYQDALPTENGDRRWMIVFTPWPDADGAAAAKGLPGADSLPAYFKRLGASMRAEPGAWRAWLMGIDLSPFDADGRAPFTDERQAMTNSSEDFTEQTVRDVILQGGSGVDIEAFSSVLLMNRVQVSLGEKPDTRSWNRILTDLGYQQHPVQIWWSGRSHRAWTKKSLEKDKILEIFNRSAFNVPS